MLIIYAYVQLSTMAISTTIGFNRTIWAPHSGKEWWKRMLDPALWERESLFFIFIYIYIIIYHYKSYIIVLYIYISLSLSLLMFSSPSPKLCQSVEGKIQPAARWTGYEAPVWILFIAHETKTWASGDLKSCLTADRHDSFFGDSAH